MVSDAGVFDRELPVVNHCCACGTYDCDVPVLTINERNPRLIYVDKCIASELMQLWANGIETKASCCGHGKTTGSIAVSEEYSEYMESLGYVREPTMFPSTVFSYVSMTCDLDFCVEKQKTSIEYYKDHALNVKGNIWRSWLED